jgi:hypothetical protein
MFTEISPQLATGWWCSLGTPVSSTNNTDRQDITEILLKVALNTIKLTLEFIFVFCCQIDDIFVLCEKVLDYCYLLQ